MSEPRPTRPRPLTAADWGQHAEELHRDGLAVLDAVAGIGTAPEVAAAHTARAAALFAAAESAAAMAAYTFMADGLT